MRFGWKVLMPISIVWIMLVGIIRGLSLENDWGFGKLLAIAAGIVPPGGR
mgnify:CR=1 FL=1